MPLYDFKCQRGHQFERRVPVEQFDYAQMCDCGAIAFQVWIKTPGMFTPDSATVKADRAAYFSHNITYTGGTKEIGFKANSHSQQCGCEQCGRHRRRAAVTEVADAASSKVAAKEVKA